MSNSTMKQEMVKWQIQQSMGEEISAESAYRLRALFADENGDGKTAALFDDVSRDELAHYYEFRDRLLEVGGNPTTGDIAVALKVDVPKFKVGDKVTYKYNGIEVNGEITEEPKKVYRLGYVYRVTNPSMSTTGSGYEWQSERTLRLACEPCQR